MRNLGAAAPGRHTSAMIKRPGKTAARQRPPKRPMLPTDRLAYSANTERTPLKLPDGALATGPKAP